MTSDELFATLPKDKKYDMIFIDGLHHELFVHRDIINSLKHLNPGGVICVHDVIPINYTATTAYYDGEIHKQGWNGDVWKAIANLQNFNIEFYTIFNEDQGLTIIKYRENPYELNISDVKTNIKYEFVWDDNYDRLDAKHFTPQGQFIMHVIDESHIDYIL